MDGVGDLHDLIRGRAGNFSNAEKVIAHIKSSTLVSSYQIACTVVRDNVYGLHDLLDYAITQEIHIKYRLAVPHQRLYTENIVEPFALNDQEKYHLCIFLESLIQSYEQSAAQRFFYRSLIDQLMYGQARKAGCNWQHRGITLSSRGKLLYCAVASDELGDITLEDSSKLYFDNAPHLENIIDKKCDQCNHDYGGIPAGNEFVKQCLMEGADQVGLPVQPFLKGEIFAPLGKTLRTAKLYRQLRKYQLHLPDPAPASHLKNNGDDAPCKVMICGWYGTETLGDKAILAGVVHSIQQSLANVDLSLVSLEPYLSHYSCQQMPELSGIKVISLTEALDQVSDMDLLVFGGGPLMAVNALLDMLALFNLSAKAQKPTILAGCGVGPQGSTLHNHLIMRILKLSSVLIYRDEKSKAVAAMLGIDTQKNKVSEDPAHVWLRQNRPQSIETDRVEKRLILGLREWPQQQYSTYSNKEAQSITQQYEMNLMNGLVKLVEEFPELRIIPFPMCTNHHGSDDRFYYRQLFRRYSAQYNKIKSNVDNYYLTHEISPKESCALFSGVDAAVAMRFHSLVFALEMQIPSVALDYTLGQGKVSSLANRFNVSSLLLDQFTTEQFVDIVKPMLQTPRKTKLMTQETNFVEDFKQAISLLRSENLITSGS